MSLFCASPTSKPLQSAKGGVLAVRFKKKVGIDAKQALYQLSYIPSSCGDNNDWILSNEWILSKNRTHDLPHASYACLDRKWLEFEIHKRKTRK